MYLQDIWYDTRIIHIRYGYMSKNRVFIHPRRAIERKKKRGKGPMWKREEWVGGGVMRGFRKKIYS